MTYDEFVDQVHKTYMAQEASMDFRLGQIYFNMLCELRPDISEVLRGSMIDPFYKERITQVVHNFVSERW
jgi:hypothetical protein